MSMLDKFMLTGKSVIITGGAGSIGTAVGNAMVDLGANIIVVDTNEELAKERAEQYCARGSDSIGLACDITNEEDVNRVVAETMRHYGKIDVLFNNAGIFLSKPAEEMTYQEWKDHIEVNFNGAFLMSTAVGREMIARKQGSIVTTASMSGIIVNYPRPQSAYNAAKAGLIHMMKSLAMEWAPYNIRVNCISPGYIDNARLRNRIAPEMVDFFNSITPMHRMVFAEELAGAVIYLASDAASATTGVNIPVDAGYTIL